MLQQMMVFFNQHAFARRPHSTHVGCVSDNLVLDLLPALQTLLDQNLWRERQTLRGQVPQLLVVVGKTGTKTTKREGGTENDGVADFGGSVKSSLNGRDSGRLSSGDVDL